ncbi:hypothetical protein K456DRAFT_1229803 [Colletotrichum gloeosporioides 23]|nr:hypothetical protein K456DRAFT_1229803 [Colletotrichum gloeosporioides 23]
MSRLALLISHIGIIPCHANPSIHPSILPSAPSISHPISKHHPHSAPSVSPREPSRAIRIRPSSARAPLARSTTTQRMRKGPSHTHTHTPTHTMCSLPLLLKTPGI